MLPVSMLIVVCLVNTVVTDEVRPLPPEMIIPQVPRAPNCGDSFPGTPKWNQCWDNFQKEMALFQYRMQQYTQQMIERAISAKSKDIISSKMVGTGTMSNVFTNGYNIQTKGLPISTTSQNGEIQIKLAIAANERIESKYEERGLEIRVGSNEQWAKIRVPDQVKLGDLKYQRTDDNIIIIGPIPNSTGKSGNQHSTTSQFFSNPFANGFMMASSMNQGQAGRIPNSQMWFF